MTRPENVLRYFAELAPVGRGPRWNHAPATDDLVTLPWPWEVEAEGAGALILETKSRVLEHLWNAARIHGSRDFLRMGWMFLSGTCEIDGRATRLFVPIASAPVRLRRPPRTQKNRYYQIVADADFGVPDSLFPDHVARQRLNEQLDALVTEAFPPGASVMSWPLVRPFVDSFCDALAIPRPAEIVPPQTEIVPTSGALTISYGVAVYTARDRSAINLESTLRQWSGEHLDRTALAHLYGEPAPATVPDLSHAVANSLPLNRTQEEAILMARSLPITVISGPPGTGKTHTAVALALDQVRHGNSVLIAAQSDDAVDAIESVLTRYSRPRHVRFGSKSSRKAVADELSDGLVADPALDPTKSYRQLEEMEAGLDRIHSSVRRRLQIEAEFSKGLRTRVRNAWCLADAPGLNEVLDSPAHMDKVLQLLGRRGAGGVFGPLRRFEAIRRSARRLGITPLQLERIAEPAQELIRAEQAVRAGQAAASQSIESAYDELESAAAEVRTLFGRDLEAMRSGRSWAAGASRAVGLLATALRSGQSARRQALQSLDIGDALVALPLWIGTLADIDDVLPVRPAMFDVVIIDEASQVNQVRAATSLARGSRAVIIGDPRQLRHVSFVGDKAMKAAAEKAQLEPSSPLLDVRRNSLFDVAASNMPVVQLAEHYRSAPHLIAFSSREFYQGRLRLMTEHPEISQADVIDVERVDGRRTEAGVVQEEADRILQLLETAAADGLNSVGVVTPFRAQADAMEAIALRRFTPEQLDQLDLRIGTVHGFQGNERDHIFVSLGIDPADLRPLRFVEDPNLFNVMVTRARVAMTVVLSIDPDGLPPGLLLSYLQHASAGLAGPESRPGSSRGWSQSIASALRPFGLALWENYPVGGYTIDIVVGSGAAAVGVECAIHPDGVDAHMARHVALTRVGWDLMSAMESRFLAQPEDAAQAIARRVIRRGGNLAKS